MGTDRDAFYLDGWGYDRLQAASSFYSDYGPATARTPTAPDFEDLRQEIQAQAEVIEAQDWQIEALQEERDALLAELDEKDAQYAKAMRALAS
jgi:predicted RNase H-like nuclease (RuvC/YqgF family)